MMVPGESQQQDGPASQRFGPPDEFVDLVRDALLHLYDLAHLQTHPLTTLIQRARKLPEPAGALLRRELLEAIESLRPAAGVPASSRSWRLHQVIELRYVAEEDVSEILRELVISKSQYHREHQHALRGIAALLWERWELRQHESAASGAPRPRAGATALVEHEAARLQQQEVVRWIDLEEVAQGTIELLAPLCQHRNVAVHVLSTQPLPPIFRERTALRHALLIALTHAITASEQTSVTVQLKPCLRGAEISITGRWAAGSDAVQAALQESRPFVDTLSGELILERANGIESCSTIRLILPSSSDQVLLVVDNNGDFVRLVQRYLTPAGWTVVGAATVDEAVQLVAQAKPKAILLDVVIPDRDGWDLLQSLKRSAATRDIPVIICSVLDEPDVAIALGAMAYLHKPVNGDQLLEALARAG
ncbi:MAG: response regulator [Chloroflexi bacterium]|nr:response regulator [Chloroflexota bacterium]